MYAFYPKNFKSLEVLYVLTEPGQEYQFNQCPYDPEIEFKHIESNGMPLNDDDLETHLFETFGDIWEQEIIQKHKYGEVA